MSNRKRRKCILLVITAGAVLSFLSGILLYASTASAGPWGWGTRRPEFQKGICYVTWARDRYLSPQSDAALKELAKTGAGWVAITINWYQDKCYTTKIFSTSKTASDASLIHAIETVHSLGMKVLLKPHIDLLDVSGGSWRGEIACITEPDWNEWFNNYANFILHYAKLAQDHKVEVLCIGTELASVATTKEKMWRAKVIEPVRKVYKGSITYAANWNEEYSQVRFWDALDYIGIDAYFPLSENDRPDFNEIKKGWEVWVKDIEALQARVNKPVIFTEIGYSSAPGAAKTPWEENMGGKADPELQADCYRAAFETFWDKSWFYGMYWWHWGTDVRYGGALSKGYTFQHKPARDLVTRWYKSERKVKGKY